VHKGGNDVAQVCLQNPHPGFLGFVQPAFLQFSHIRLDQLFYIKQHFSFKLGGVVRLPLQQYFQGYIGFPEFFGAFFHQPLQGLPLCFQLLFYLLFFGYVPDDSLPDDPPFISDEADRDIGPEGAAVLSHGQKIVPRRDIFSISPFHAPFGHEVPVLRRDQV